MSLSNRVSLDTDVIFIRNMFVFSTNTNNVPVSTNTILAIGANGQMVASNTLYNLSTYGVGYLPSTLSTINGDIISVGNLVLAGGVTPGQLISVQTALQSSISTTQGSVNTLSSYVLLNVIPSTVSTFDSQVSSLNSSFQGYVAGASVTPGQLTSTYTAATIYTNQQISTLSTNTYIQICTLSNYFNVSSATVTQFSTLAGNVSAQSNYFSTQINITNSNFNALSTSTRLLNVNNSTLIGGLEEEVSTLTTIVVATSTVTTPLGTLGLLSTSQCANWPFFSNIKVSSIDVQSPGTAAAPAINFTSGGDNDTGIYHPTDGAIAFTVNSTEMLRIAGNATYGSTYINLFGTSNGFAALNPFNYPVLTLTSGCNDNNNSARIELFMPSTSYKTFIGGGTGSGGIEYRQLQTFAYDLTSGGAICTATSIHSTGTVGIRGIADPTFALTVNGSVRQTVPLIWEYRYNTIIPGNYAANVPYTLSNYEPSGLPTILGPSDTLTVPYDGTYTITCQSQVINSPGGTTITIYVNGLSNRAGYTNTNGYINISYTSTILKNSQINVFAQIFSPQVIDQPMITLQYWG